MSIENPIELRKHLLAAGYHPLPARGKRVLCKNWSSLEITDAWLSRRRSENTGLRCDDVFGIDLDVSDEALCDELEAFVVERLGPAPCRFGRPPRRLLLYRAVGAPGARLRGARWVRPGADEPLQVEVLSGPGSQFLAYGVHPDGFEYVWRDGQGPAQMPWSFLTGVERDDVRAVLSGCDDLLAGAGLERLTVDVDGSHDFAVRYELTDDTPVQVLDEAPTTWGQLKAELSEERLAGNLWRAETGELGDSGKVYFCLNAGMPVALDLPRSVTWASVEDGGDVADDLAALAAVLPARPMSEEEAARAALKAELVLMATGEVRRLSHPEAVAFPTTAKLRDYTRWLDFQTLRANGTVKRDAWAHAWMDDCLRADGALFLPDRPEGLIEYRGLTVLNTYQAPRFPAPHEHGAVFDEFLDHLFPYDGGAELFFDWLALKVAYPALRQHAVLMTTPTFGVGRGLLSDVVRALLGERYCREITWDKFSGTGGQAQFTEWMESLFVYVPEVRGGDDWQHREATYETLKERVDPRVVEREVTRKGLGNVVVPLYYSVLISSNYSVPMRIEDGDRRVMVLDNGRVPLVQRDGLLEGVLALKDSPAMLASLRQELMERAGELDPALFCGAVHDTAARQRMIADGRSPLEEALVMLRERARCVLVTWPDALATAEKACADIMLSWSPRVRANAVRDALTRVGGGKVGRARLADGSRVDVWCLDPAEYGRWEAASTSEVTSEVQRSVANVSKVRFL